MIIWKTNINLKVLDVHQQCVSVLVREENTDYDIVMTAVYADTYYIIRRELWNHLSDMSDKLTEPWVIGGDYNAIMRNAEKLGGAAPNIRAMNDFLHFQHDNDLIDLGFDDSAYTWTNNNHENPIWERLDRILINHNCINMYPNTNITHHTHLLSDHSPITICNKEPAKYVSSFKFLTMWTTHPDCERLIAETWNADIKASSLCKLQIKLKMLKEKLKFWNKNTFGNIYDKIKEAKYNIKQLEERLEVQFSILVADLLLEEKKLEMGLLKEEMLLRDKSQQTWLKDGDRNTAFFHASLKIMKKGRSFTRMILTWLICCSLLRKHSFRCSIL